MAHDKQALKQAYPLPVYNYRVTIQRDGAPLALSFAEVVGLSNEYAPVTYKHGMSFAMGAKVIPGMQQPIRITLKRGITQSRDELYQWFSGVYGDPSIVHTKRDILIDLCDEAGQPVIRWRILQALPVKLDAPTFTANSNEVAIETMEFVAHDLQVEYRP